MSFRTLTLLFALPALVIGALVSLPAQSAGHALTTSTYNVAINENGIGRVLVGCHTKATCTGGIYMAGDYDQIQHYSVKGHSLAYVFVKIDKDHPAYPYDSGQHEGEYGDHGPQQLVIKETRPKSDSHQYTILPQIKVAGQVITGHVTAKSGTPIADDVRVELWRIGNGGSTQFLKSDDVDNGGTFSHAVALGTNNAGSSQYELRIVDGSGRSWFWRGANGSPAGGGRYIIEATRIVANKLGPYVADFKYGSISGTARRDTSLGDGLPNTSITVAAIPPSFGSGRTNVDLDVRNCANIYGETETDSNGNYKVGFLPYGGPDKRYVVLANPRPNYPGTLKLPLWNNEFGSCENATGYKHSNANLIDLSSGSQTQNFAVRESTNDLVVNAGYSGYTPTSSGDRFVRVREKVPGVAPLNAPVIAQKIANSSGVTSFTDLPRGAYWVEIGRRTGCSTWYASRYSNNTAYFNGADRGAEAWKTVGGAAAEYKKSYDMGYVRKNPPSGYHGWMYRDHCKAFGTGSITTAAFHGNDANERQTSTPTIKRGAVVKGHVSRSGGRTNKEMMVRVSSSRGVLVYRTHFTNSGGNFTIQGLASGTYTISVNPDSWRGIGRGFTGKHTIKVTAGRTYNVGTLRFTS